jgi:GNAT superfamily N-acetyltransferase
MSAFAPDTVDSMMRALTSEHMATPEFRHLLWLATEEDDARICRIMRDVLPGLEVHGAVERGRVVAFVAFDASVDPLVIEYIAVAEDAQGRGLGTALVEVARRDANGGPVYAQTDDDAVDFYRRVGFSVSDRPRDPRWPERQRYDCMLGSRGRPD